MKKSNRAKISEKNLYLYNRWPVGLKISMVFLLLGISLSFAYKPKLRSSEVLSVRQMGMGKAYTAIANDETLLQANPAGIGVHKMFQLNKDDGLFYFLPMQFGFSGMVFDKISSAFSGGGAGFLGGEGYDVSVKLGSLTDFVYAGDFWAISFITRGEGIFFYENNQEINSDYKFDTIALEVELLSRIHLGFNVHSFSIFSDKDFHIGVGAKFWYTANAKANIFKNSIARAQEDLEAKYGNLGRNYTPSQLVDDVISEVLNSFHGFGIGLDIGVLWEIPIKATEHKINVGIMLEDFPSYGFSSLPTPVVNQMVSAVCEEVFSNFENIVEESPEEFCNSDKLLIPESTFYIPNAKIGVAYMLPNYFGSFLRNTLFAFDLHRIGDPDYGFADMYHLGASTSIFDFTDQESGRGYRMNVSTGVSQNYFNVGILFHLKVYEMAYNYYSKALVGSGFGNSQHVFTFAFYL